MGNTTITIYLDRDPSYDPSPLVHRNDQVTFKLHDVPYDVDIYFDDGCPFSTPPPYHLNGTTIATASSLETVATNAAERGYSFRAVINNGTPGSRDGANAKIGGQLETKKGGIDVTTEPPKDPDKKKKK
ncbi:hypothetical protein JY651_06440 [Pyxidicoccus parkwayensis]|uniref:Uncharacterized protein n=1 Tax=Pyxidicoccus parkwayensis TaxID=2813578 RepID=A0ABX7P2A6_9BACT|nr:hypothetical protein [Pyxidicoccus parkwaysis]QSQ24586.1 hypothetical protein JY651_06440 [Pyxidicoccus parkwaysis]